MAAKVGFSLCESPSKFNTVDAEDDDDASSCAGAESDDNESLYFEADTDVDDVGWPFVISNESGMDKVGPGSPLHVLCASPQTNLAELRSCLAENMDAPFILNQTGQTPLHVLTENLPLWDRSQPGHVNANADADCEAVRPFAMNLISINPAAVVQTDCLGRWPCRSLLQRWTGGQDSGRTPTTASERLTDFVRRGVGTVLTLTSTTTCTSSSTPLSSGPSPHAASAGTNEKTNHIYSPTQLSLPVDDALSLLSHALVTITMTNAIYQQQSLLFQEKICFRIATQIPQLVAKLLLLQPERDQQRIFNLPLLRRLLLEPLITGSWMVSMIRKKGKFNRHRAVTYLLLISSSNIQHFYPSDCPILIDHNESGEASDLEKAFQQNKAQTLQALGDMGGELILSLGVLDDKERTRAVSGSALWHIMQQGLMRPFVIGVVLIDFVLHITLMLSFRSGIMADDDSGLFAAVPSNVITAITVFFLTRKVSVGMTLWNISHSVFKAHVLDFWNLFDFLSILFIAVANLVNRGTAYSNPDFNAFVLALLWLKVLAFLKAVNMQMATFILSLIRIVVDIRFFIVVLVVVIMMFGDVMRVIYTTTVGANNVKVLCTDASEAAMDFCSDDVAPSYFRMYGLLIGDISINDYRGASSTVVVFVAFTILGVIILLNVLIAIVSDSYENSKVGAKGLFATARIGFLAEHLALEDFLQPGTNPFALLSEKSDLRDHRSWLSIIGRVLRWLILLGMLTTVLFAEFFLLGQAVAVFQDGSNNFFLLIFLGFGCIVLTVALWTVFHVLFSGVLKSLPYTSSVLYIVDGINIVMAKVVNCIRTIIFGNLTVVDGVEKDTNEEVIDRMDNLEAVMLTSLTEFEKRLAIRVQASS